ncbi:MAG TPA: phenylalanine--tRNA ligase subunit beta [Tissierellales bacterium]|nr:phenylalanine--tRNA ligase subunit beta [Tissierellales bacterium]
MLVPVKWLKEYVDLDVETKKLADELTLSGSHVESIISLDRNIENIVVGKILTIEKHPNADKLLLLKVDIGSEKLQIITGATNIRKGDYVPVALVGAILPNNIKIKKSKLRGIDSFGMLCSFEELGFDNSVIPKEQKDGILILDKEYPLGEDIIKVLKLYGEVIEFEITPNRPDCLSIIGMARETSATFNKTLNYPKIELEEEVKNINNYIESIEILNKDLCPRYYSRVIKDVIIEPSPLWLQLRLMEAGVRPINNIVDITNYVMLELGEPLHAFDIDKIEDKKIYIRPAKENEKIRTIDNIERKLDSSNLVIADEKKPIAIAGVMGGLNSEVTKDTKTILIEAANFNKKNVRITSKKLGLRTEASARFEKGIDVNLAEIACNRVCQLIEEIGVGKVVKGYIDVYERKEEKISINLKPERVNKMLGIEITTKEMIDILHSLEFKVEENNTELSIIVPTFRLDITEEVDLIEEIGRIYGFHNIENKPFIGYLTRGERPYNKVIENKAKNILVGLGLNEIMTYSFISPKSYDKVKLPGEDYRRNYVKILNPLGEDYSSMRTTLIPNMLKVLSRNYNYGVENAYAFEIGNVFLPKELPLKELPKEKAALCLGMYGNDVDYYAIKEIIDILFKELGILNVKYIREEENPTFHPGRTANIVIKDNIIGVIGEVHPDISENYSIKENAYLVELDFDAIINCADLSRKYKPLPKYPAIVRDVAIVLDKDTMVQEIEEVILDNGKGLINEIKLFDIYEGEQVPEGMKSIAYSIVYRSYERTLKDDEISKLHSNIIKKLEESFNAELRS